MEVSGEWSASRPGRFIPVVRAPGTHWTGGWVGPKAGLDSKMLKSPRYPLDRRLGSGEEKKSHHCPRLEMNRDRPAHSLLSVLTEHF
jgi:hypothetical protein